MATSIGGITLPVSYPLMEAGLLPRIAANWSWSIPLIFLRYFRFLENNNLKHFGFKIKISTLLIIDFRFSKIVL